MFTYEVYIPSTDSYVRFKELTNEMFVVIQKYIQSNDNAGLLGYFNELISELCTSDTSKLNRIDIFCALATIRMVCVGSILELQMKTESSRTVNKISIYDIVHKVSNEVDRIKDYKVQINNDISITLNLPQSLLYDNAESFILDCIHTLTIKDQSININNASEEQRDEVFKLLSGDIFNIIIEYLNELTSDMKDIQIIGTEDTDEAQTIKVNVFDNSLFEVIRFLFKDDLAALYEKQYAMASKLHMSVNDFNALTPAETDIHINRYVSEVKEHNNRAKSNKSPGLDSMF